MSYLKKPFTFGKIVLPSNIFYAPLAGCSDYPFRKMTSKYKPGLIFTEMVKMDALVRNDQGTFHMLDHSPDMHPIGGQFCGSKVELAKASAKIIEDLGFDTVDFNCGCPVDKVTKDGSGSGMLKSPNKIGDIIAEMCAGVKIPVTVKIRTGWDEASINAVEITKIAEAAGATAICIHGRTRAQAYRGNANWDHIKACKDAATTIKVIGNGDLFDAESVKRMFEYTGCDAVLVARGTMGQPWIAQDIENLLSGHPIQERPFKDNVLTLLEHFECMVNYHVGLERRVLIDMRRVGCWYIKKCFGAREVREYLNKATSTEEIRSLLYKLLEQASNPDFMVQHEEQVDNIEDTCECSV